LRIPRSTFMKKILLLVASGLLLVINPALAKNDSGSSIHIDQNRQFPETRWANADHFIRIHVPQNSAALTELRLRVPENLKFEVSQVEVFNLQGQKIAAVVTETDSPDKTIQLTFAAPVASDAKFDIRIKNVKKTLVSRPSTYAVSAKSIGSNQEQFVGEAYFRSY
jgi:Protein of unknown function (DUF2808)